MKCTVCKTEKDDAKFYKTYKYSRKVCKVCENKRLAAWRKIRSRRLKEIAVLHFGGKCTICGYKKCMKALDFHHHGEKKFGPSVLIRNSSRLEQILPELNKCVLICANCHREQHE